MIAVEKKDENIQKCACPQCPSHNNCMKEKMEGLFCSEAVGKSTCEFEKLGCICGTCPVQIEHELVSGYYCDTGAPNV